MEEKGRIHRDGIRIFLILFILLGVVGQKPKMEEKKVALIMDSRRLKSVGDSLELSHLALYVVHEKDVKTALKAVAAHREISYNTGVAFSKETIAEMVSDNKEEITGQLQGLPKEEGVTIRELMQAEYGRGKGLWIPVVTVEKGNIRILGKKLYENGKIRQSLP